MFPFDLAFVLPTVARSVLAAAQVVSAAHVPTPLAQSLMRGAPDASPAVLERAANAATCAQASGLLASSPQRLAVVDFSRPSSTPRMWIFDLATGQVLARQQVAHGKGSGVGEVPTVFSNQAESMASSLGLFRVSEPYKQDPQAKLQQLLADRGATSEATDGKTVYVDPMPRVKLDGLYPGFNTNVRERGVVLHSSAYVTDGHTGLSEGCFAIDRHWAVQDVQWLANGQGALFADAPDPTFQRFAQSMGACSAVRKDQEQARVQGFFASLLGENNTSPLTDGDDASKVDGMPIAPHRRRGHAAPLLAFAAVAGPHRRLRR